MLVYKIIDGEYVPTWQYMTPLSMEIGDCFIQNMPDGRKMWVQKKAHIVKNGAPMITCMPIEEVGEQVA